MVAPHLQPIWDLLQRAFPSGVDAEEYLPLLSLLYPHLGDRNLRDLIAAFTGKNSAQVLNDIYAVGVPGWVSGQPQQYSEDVRARLSSAGFDECVNEDE